jgi:hypothetical protein
MPVFASAYRNASTCGVRVMAPAVKAPIDLFF